MAHYLKYGNDYDVDTLAFLTATGISDSTQITAIEYLVTNLKSNNLWTKMKALYPFVGGTAFTHKFNLKDPRDLDAAFRLTFYGGLTHSSTGCLPNGSSGYADTHLIPNNTLELNSTHISYYSKTLISDDGIEFGCLDNNNKCIYSYMRYLNDYTYIKINVSNADPSLEMRFSNITGEFYGIFNRISNTIVNAFKNTSKYILNVNSNSLPINNIYLMALNNCNVTNYFSVRECAFASIGDGLTDTDALNLYNIVQAYQVILSRQV